MSEVVAKRVAATAAAQLGRTSDAQAWIAEVLKAHESTDDLNEQGKAFVAAAEVARLCGDDSERYLRVARERFTRKGNLVAAAACRRAPALP
jgi:hypothetical protein